MSELPTKALRGLQREGPGLGNLTPLAQDHPSSLGGSSLALPTLWQAGMSLREDLAPQGLGAGQGLSGGHLTTGKAAQASSKEQGGIGTHAPTHSVTCIPSSPFTETHTHTRSRRHTGHADFCVRPHNPRVCVCLSDSRTPSIQALTHSLQSSVTWMPPTLAPPSRCASFLTYTPESPPPQHSDSGTNSPLHTGFPSHTASSVPRHTP